MADCKRKTGNFMLNTWQHSLRKLGTATDTITTLPADIYPTDTTATVGLKGNMSQTGTPTPDNPIMPQGTGERTGNLFDINATPTKYSQSTTVTVDGRTLTISGAWYIYYEIDVAPNTDYYVDWTIDYAEIQGRGTIAILTTSGQTIKQQDLRPFRFNSGENQRIRLYIYSGNNEPTTIILSNIMLNSGSEALPYEPYGYKIPISSANTTTPVYLGEVETTRKVKKLVLTGSVDENWTENTSGTNTLRWRLAITEANLNQAEGFCTHVPFVATGIGQDTELAGTYNSAIFLRLSKTICNNLADFKSYLAQQYAAGTPVTVWYVLANEETGIVNEPLMKIGNYADTVSGISIPVTAGGDSIDIETTVKPSEVSLTYTGWHDSEVIEIT